MFGAGTFDRAADEVDRLGAERILLIADRSGSAWADRLAETLGARLVGRIDDVLPHVPIESAEAARALARETGADTIVTLGGGSATGLGKAVALAIPVPILAIPTTYAGSEMTPIWGLTDGTRKETGRDPSVQPRTVIYDPLLTLSLPPSIAGPSGMNALAHCVEAVYADGANPVITLMALEGVGILSRGLPTVVAAPDDVRRAGRRARRRISCRRLLRGCRERHPPQDLPCARRRVQPATRRDAYRRPAALDRLHDAARAGGDRQDRDRARGRGRGRGGVRPRRAPRGTDRPRRHRDAGRPPRRGGRARRRRPRAAARSPSPRPRCAQLLGDAFAGHRPTPRDTATPAPPGPIAPPITA